MASLTAGVGYGLWRLTAGNPILLSVLRQSARRTMQTWIRTGYVAVLIVVALIGLAGGSDSAGVSMSKLGREGERIFSFIALFQVALICVLAPVFTAGALQQLREPRTLGVLLASPLSNGQIVLGSLLSRVFLIWALLAGGLPILAITRMFGRVSNEQIFLATGVAATTALVTGAVAIAWGAAGTGAKKSQFTFFLAIFAYLILIPGLEIVPWFRLPEPTAGTPGYTGHVTWLTPLHPIALLTVLRAVPSSLGEPGSWEPPSADLVRQLGYGSPWDWYLSRPAEAYILITFILAFVLIVPTVILLRNEPAAISGPARGLAARWGRAVRATALYPFVWMRRVLTGALSAEHGRRLDGRLADLRLEMTGRAVRRPRTVWANPVAWREAVTRAGSGGRGAAKWIFILTGAVVALLIAGRRLQAPDSPRTLEDVRSAVTMTVAVEFLLILAVVLNSSAAGIAREREIETLNLVLSTPITPDYYVWGKLRGLITFALSMVWVPAATILTVWAADSLAGMRTGNFYPSVLPEAAPALMILMTAFCAAAAVVGLRISLNSRTMTAAVVKSTAVAGLFLILSWTCAGRMIFSAAGDSPAGAFSCLSPMDAVLNVCHPWDRFPAAIGRPERKGDDDPGAVYPDIMPDPDMSYSGRRGIGGQWGFGRGLDRSGTALRILLFLMVLLTALAYAPGVYTVYRSIVNNFQAAIRRQQQ